MKDDLTDPRPVTVGVVLAGGEARRMGRDKRLLRLAGATLLERNLRFLQELFPTVALSLRDAGQIPDPLPEGVEIVPDVLTSSPLAGIASALALCHRPVFVLAADVAFADQAAVQAVLAAFIGVDVALPVVGGHLEPLHAAYGSGCLRHIERLLERRAHSILDLLPEVRVAEVPFAAMEPFFNVNTPADWEKARLLAGDDAAGSPDSPPAVLGVIGWSGGGKTTLIERLIPELTRLGRRVAAGLLALVTDADLPHPKRFALDDAAGLAGLLVARLGLSARPGQADPPGPAGHSGRPPRDRAPVASFLTAVLLFGQSYSKPLALRHQLWALGRTMDRPWGSTDRAVVGPWRKRADLLVFGKE